MKRHAIPLALACLVAACAAPTAPLPYAVGRAWTYDVVSERQPGGITLKGTGTLTVAALAADRGELKRSLSLPPGPAEERTYAFALVPGRPWDGLVAPLMLKATPDATASEVVTTPAGAFSCEKRVTTDTREGVALRSEVWLAQDAGIVKWVTVAPLTVDGGAATVTQTWTLRTPGR